MRRSLRLPLFASACLLLSCGNVDFDPASKIESVRVLATRADKPYAKPGETVNMEVLAWDGRTDKSRPMNLWWIPVPCIDPPADAYYGCFPEVAAIAKPNVDLTPQLVSGTKFSFQMPADVIPRHKDARGSDPYGLAILFTIACTGHVEFVPPAAGASPNKVPFGCFDASHNELGPDDFVFAYSLVYSFADRTNANPTIDGLTYGGTPIDPQAGLAIDHCTEASQGRCPSTDLGITVPASSWELDPGAVQPDGSVPHEQIWVDWYVTDGRLGSEVLTIYDPKAGLLTSQTSNYRAPLTSGDQMLWAVVRDNRGGATWAQIPLRVR